MAGCSNNEKQRIFEDEAHQRPQGITQTSENGQIKNTDIDDWRISPRYQGLLRVETPAYRNPVLASTFRIDLYITSIEAIDNVLVYALNEDGKFFDTGFRGGNISAGLYPITVSTDMLMPPSTAHTADLYRIIIQDGKRRTITYGDVQIGIQ